MKLGDIVLKVSDFEKGILKLYRIYSEQKDLFNNTAKSYTIFPVQDFTTTSGETVSSDDLILAENGIKDYIQIMKWKIEKAEEMLRMVCR